MSDTPELERNKALIQEILEQVWLAGNPAAVQRYYAADYRHTDPGAPHVTDRDSLAAAVVALTTAFSDVRFSVDDVVAEGDKVAKRYVFAGTHTGELFGIPATGRRVEVAGQEIFTIRDGKVVAAVQLNDVFTMMAQLGVIPSPVAAAAP